MEKASSGDGVEGAYRYERKFALGAESLENFRHRLSCHPAFFYQQHQPRYVNNLYFENMACESLLSNLDGTPQRAKTRVRWYGDLVGDVGSPSLETKRKQGAVGTKQRVELPGFVASEFVQVVPVVGESLAQATLPVSLQFELEWVRPALLNRYRREYFVSAAGFRITIDSNLQFFAPGQITEWPIRSNELIVELKYDVDRELDAADIVQPLGLRVARNSKYVTGMLALG